MNGKTRIWAGMALLFVSGLAIGFFGASYLIRRHVQEFVTRGPTGMSARVVRYALDGIDLSAGQKDEIDGIMSDVRPRMRELSERFGESVRELTDEQFDRIRTVLDDEQAGIFDERIEQMQRRMDMMRERRGVRPGRPPHGRTDHGNGPL